ncbi:interferon-induced protein 44-like [Pagrus major]|uniref:interferon-induced protein 44-like n=1 Tax=Pagrus major TaxID=143350 RepID=UPI003CC8C3E6
MYLSVFSKPWREINWGDKVSALQHVKNYKPTERHQLRILLHGPAGAGKSSFINSVQSVLRGRMYTQALVDNVSYGSFTRKYTTYKIPKGDQQSFYPFVFNDIMGLDPKKGVPVDDVKLALGGHVKDGYKFDPESKLSEYNPFYNKYPKTNDKVHVLVCVIDANTVSTMRDETMQKIRDIRMEASDLDIPQVAILTKIDEACPEIKADLKNVYKVQSMKEKMEEFSANVGIPMNCIFPVKNYHQEINIDSDVDSLILSALRDIIRYGDDFINLKKSDNTLFNFFNSSSENVESPSLEVQVLGPVKLLFIKPGPCEN